VVQLHQTKYLGFLLPAAVMSAVAFLSALVLFFHNHLSPAQVAQSKPTTSTKTKSLPQSTAQPVKTGVVLFSDPLNGADRIVTNEYVHWNPKSSCAYTSKIWDMTSGTLLVKNGAGYSGIPTAEASAICESATKNNSAVFRLNTRQNNFSNAKVSVDYMAVQHGGANAKQNGYDGIHIWVGYQNEYALYSATIFRWDQTLVIKKKVPLADAKCSDPSNGGCYYNLSSEKTDQTASPSNVWHHADIVYKVDKSGVVTIEMSIDGTVVANGTDSAVHGSAYAKGAVGIRGDDTEFYFKNFTVVAL